MKYLLIICGLLATISTTAQTISLTIINEIDTDMAFFDVFTINANTGEVIPICKHQQAFNGMIHFTALKTNESEELVIQRRTHPDRQLLGEYAARVSHTKGETAISVIEQSDRFRVVEGLTFGEAIVAPHNVSLH